MSIESAKRQCTSERNHKSALVSFQSQEELKYVALAAHVGKYTPVEVWTGLKRQNKKWPLSMNRTTCENCHQGYGEDCLCFTTMRKTENHLPKLKRCRCQSRKYVVCQLQK